MIYAISDIHGCRDKYLDLLRKIRFGPEDTLYVLGDVVDRGPDGFRILLDMVRRPNVAVLLGNHEAMAIDVLSRILRALRHTGEARLTGADADAVELWFYNGGEASLTDFFRLNSEQREAVWAYLLEMPLYKEIAVGGRRFVLVHGGLENFSLSRPLEDYAADEILWCRPDPDTVYYPDKYVIFGHTPVQILGGKRGVPPTFCHGEKWIDIDCGCVFSDGRLGCLCLDTMDEIYV